MCDNDRFVLPAVNFVGGATQSFVFHSYSGENKEPFDLTGCTANFAMVNYVNKHGSPVVSKSMTISSDQATSISNILNVTLEPSETINLYGKYIYQITIKNDSGAVEPPMQGVINIEKNINKDFILQ